MYVCVWGGGGGVGVSCCKQYLQGMYGSSSLCLSDTYALVIDQLLLIKIMIIIDEG